MHSDFLNKEVTVLDFGNYVTEYTKNEDIPMKAVLFEISHCCYWVRSIKTGNEYELYEQQIKEFNCEEDNAIYDVDEPDFEPCENCDLPDACADFGCAIKSGIRKFIDII